MSGALGSGVALACNAWSSCQGLGLEGFHSSDRLSSLIYPHYLPPQSSGINPGKWEGLLPPRCYSFPGVRIPGQPRIRQLHCQSDRKTNNKWRQIKSTGGGWGEEQEKGEKWGKKKKKKQDEIKERDGRHRAGFWECEPCWNCSTQISTMCPPEPYYPINELYWGNKVLWSSAKTLKGPRLSRPGAKSSLIPQGTNEKRGAPGLVFTAPSVASQAGWPALLE